MKKFLLEFWRRGVSACGLGPIVLAVLYQILQKTSSIKTLTVNQVFVGILSLTVLAFIAGGMNAVYQIEQLPLMTAIFIHGIVLYISYLSTYLANNWLDFGVIPIIVFSLIFLIGYIIIWVLIHSIIKRNTEKLNEMLKQKQQNLKENLHSVED